MSRVAGQQSLPCVKGGGVRKDTGGIDAEQFTFCNANSDYSMSKNPAVHNRQPHAKTNRWGTIPQTLLTQGQPPLHKGAFGAVRCRTCGGRLKVRCGNPSGALRHLPRRRWLRIPRFRPRAKSSVTAHLLLSPPNPLALGFGGDPDGGGFLRVRILVSPNRGDVSFADRGVIRAPPQPPMATAPLTGRTPPAKSGILPPPASSMAPYPSFSPKGKKLGHCASPPFPTEPSSAAVSSFAALRMRHTPCGYYAGLWRGPHWGD